MSTPSEYLQRETDRQRGAHDRRQMDKARFGSPLSALMFNIGVDAIRPATPANLAADAASEVNAEGHLHRNTRPQRHE